MKTQTVGDIQAMLLAAGLRPVRRLGQNFLIDGNLLRKLVEAADIGPHDTVLEVGGGTGGLTDHLAQRATRVLVLEIDRNLHRLLAARFADSPNVVIHCGDALANKNRLCDFLRCELAGDAGSTAEHEPASESDHPDRGSLSLVANLPYGIAAPLLVNLLLEVQRMARFTFTVQKEVTERIEAEPDCKAYGPLAITFQTICRMRRIVDVPASAFWPRPQVESVMLRLDRLTDGPLCFSELRPFVGFVRASFLHRRKTLAYNLKSALGMDPGDIVGDMVDLRARPENVVVEQWVDLYRRISTRTDLSHNLRAGGI